MGMGTCTMSCAVWVDATKARYSGKPTMMTPSTMMRCENAFKNGLRSTISILHFLLNVAELDHGEHHHDGHQHHRLRSRSAHVHGLEAVVVDLVDQDRGVLPWAALRGGVHDGEGVEEGIDHV